MGGLGIDARDKLELQDNATVTIGAASTGNLLVGSVIGIANTNPNQGDTLVVGGNIRLTSGQIIFADGSGQSVGGSVTQFPTGDYGLLDSANVSTDAFSISVGGLTEFDMLTQPSGELATQDMGALS